MYDFQIIMLPIFDVILERNLEKKVLGGTA